MFVFIAERFSGRLGRIMESWLLDPNPLPPLLHVPPSASSSASFTHRDPVPCSAPVWFATLAPVGNGLRFGSGLRCRGPKPDFPKQRCVRNPYPTAPCRKVLLLPWSCQAMVGPAIGLGSSPRKGRRLWPRHPCQPTRIEPPARSNPLGGPRASDATCRFEAIPEPLRERNSQNLDPPRRLLSTAKQPGKSCGKLP